MSAAQFLRGILLIVVLLMISGTAVDPDLWGHVRFGQDMLDSGSIRVPDTYSFTADRPWVNHEWLSEIVMAAAFRQFGVPGLNLLRIAVTLATLALVWCSSAGIPERYKILIVGAGALGIRLRSLPVRPQLFSLLLFAALMTLINRSDRTHSWRPLWFVPIVMALWANVHGGWIVGLAVFGLWCLMTVINESWRRRLVIAVLLTASVVATLITPYGFEMWNFIGTTVHVNREMIADWQPLYKIPPVFWIPWLTAFTVVAVAAMHARTVESVKHLVIAGLLGLVAVRVSRLDAFFALAGVILAPSSLRRLNIAMMPERSAVTRRWKLHLAGVFACCVGFAAFGIASRLAVVPTGPESMPDREVAAYVRDRQLTGRILIWFDWGEYVIWHFGPRLKVSIDGRRETVYSPELISSHMQFYMGRTDAWRYPDVLKADFVWLPKQLGVVRDLKLNRWNLLCEGESSILLGRHPVADRCRTGSAQGLRSSFPDL